MNTYELRTKDIFESLTEDYQKSILEFLQDDNTKDNVSIQLQDESYGDEYYTTLYGLYDMTDDEQENYNSSGGTWLYESRLNLLCKLS